MMPLIKLCIVVTWLALVSCSTNNHEPKTVFDVDEQALSKGVLKVFLPDEAPKNFAIQNPDGDWFVIQQASDQIGIMNQRTFESLNVLELKLSTLKGTTWRDGIKKRETVFQQSGHYRIYFADNLETEPENTFSLQEMIYYQHP